MCTVEILVVICNNLIILTSYEKYNNRITCQFLGAQNKLYPKSYFLT